MTIFRMKLAAAAILIACTATATAGIGFGSLHAPSPVVKVQSTGGDGGSEGGEGGGNGGSGGPSGGAPASPDILARQRVEQFSLRYRRDIAACEARVDSKQIETQPGYFACLGDATERYADNLEGQVQILPEPLKPIPRVIRKAAREIRAARTVRAAKAAVTVARESVRKAITLIKADDPMVARQQTRQGSVMAQDLALVETKLEKAVGI